MNIKKRHIRMARAASRSAWDDLANRKPRIWLALGAILRWHSAAKGYK